MIPVVVGVKPEREEGKVSKQNKICEVLDLRKSHRYLKNRKIRVLAGEGVQQIKLAGWSGQSSQGLLRHIKDCVWVLS
jgi:hypothetical protein